jgi:hypothetical protein
MFKPFSDLAGRLAAQAQEEADQPRGAQPDPQRLPNPEPATAEPAPDIETRSAAIQLSHLAARMRAVETDERFRSTDRHQALDEAGLDATLQRLAENRPRRGPTDVAKARGGVDGAWPAERLLDRLAGPDRDFPPRDLDHEASSPPEQGRRRHDAEARRAYVESRLPDEPRTAAIPAIGRTEARRAYVESRLPDEPRTAAIPATDPAEARRLYVASKLPDEPPASDNRPRSQKARESSRDFDGDFSKGTYSNR